MNWNKDSKAIEFASNRYFIPERNVGVDAGGIIIRDFGDAKVLPNTKRFNTVVIRNGEKMGLIDVDFCDFLPCIFDYVSVKLDGCVELEFKSRPYDAGFRTLKLPEGKCASEYVDDIKYEIESGLKHGRLVFCVKRGNGVIQKIFLNPRGLNSKEGLMRLQENDAYKLLKQEIDKFAYKISAKDFEYNGHAYVDLNLPSGTKWATCNVGASTPEKIGDYFAWGETEVCENVDDLEDDNYMYEDNPDILPASADVASVKWGEGWRMPTKEEFEELIDMCTYELTEKLGAKGWLFTGPNGNSIFLPAYETEGASDLGSAGFYGTYWSSSLNTEEPNCAWYLYLSKNNVDISEYLRVRGLLIRPVCLIKK